MRILVTFAVDAEFAPWRKLRNFSQACNGLVTLYVAKAREAELNVLLTGVGVKAAWPAASKKIWDSDVDVCISSGLAGALKADLRVGEVLVAQRVRAASSGNTVAGDTDLVALATEAGARVVQSFCTVERIVLRASEKKTLGESSDVVEMESAEVLAEAAAFGARVVAIRGISDVLEEDLPVDFNRTTTANGEISLPRVPREVVRHPSALPALMRFGKQSRMAAAQLCHFLDRYVESLAAVHVGAAEATSQ